VPSSPAPLEPQHLIPPVISAHVCEYAAAIWMAVWSVPRFTKGSALPICSGVTPMVSVLPMPSWPFPFNLRVRVSSHIGGSNAPPTLHPAR